MSTTFGICIRPSLDDEAVYKLLESDDEYSKEDNFTEVAFRSSNIRWSNPIAQFLSDDIRVYPLDNSAQGIYTIGDIKLAMKNYKKL